MWLELAFAPPPYETAPAKAMNEKLLDTAIKYLEMGIPVFPVIGKYPPQGFKWAEFQDRIPTIKEIKEWFEKYPGITGIAMPMGKLSGMIAIDCDVKDPKKSINPEILKRLKSEGHPESLTGSFGSHFFVSYDPSLGFTSNAGVLTGLDIKSHGGYVLLPPSIALYGQDELEYHRFNRNEYKWVKEYKSKNDLKHFPAWLLKMIGQNKKSGSGKDWKEKMINPIEKGSRNVDFTSIIGGLLNKFDIGEWESFVWPVVVKLNKAQDEPLPESELRTVFESIKKRRLINGVEKNNKTSKVVSVCFADINPEPINWLWPEYIALGKITLIAGDPGLGKSLITSMLAAIVSKGYNWPLNGSSSPVGNIILLSAEDDPADTIRPRLDAAGADCNSIHIIKSVEEVDADGNILNRMFSFKRDIVVLDECLSTLQNCKLVVIDPVSAYLDGTDGNSNSDLRGLFAPLAGLASKYKVAVVLIQHLNKGSGGNAIYRPMGSLAFIATARAAFIVTKDIDNPHRRLFMPAKNNIAKENVGLAYSITEAENGAPVIAWESESITITADEALAIPQFNEERTATDDAVNFLKNLLSAGPVSAAEADKQARQLGIGNKPLRSARGKLGIKPIKTGFSGGWVWALPQDALKTQEAHSFNEGNLEPTGQLGQDEPIKNAPT
jgi:putative DNA primase/helicase